jgi:signal peptidase I
MVRESQGDAKQSRHSFFEMRYWLRDMILSLLLAFVVIFFLYQPVQVEGTSMAPHLANHERILVNKLSYRLGPIRRGDIVVFRFPLDPSKSYIKRVIGLPGEWVSIVGGRVLINGAPLDEPYLARHERLDQTFMPVLVPPGQYYVLGDHRGMSNDSRVWGTVDGRFIYGKAVFAYWPLDQLGVLR